MIPLKQTVSITKGGELDAWGVPAAGIQTAYKCRIDEKTDRIQGPNGGEVQTTADILIKGLVQIGFSDAIEWVDESGLAYVKSPLVVQVIRDLGGKPLFTKVTV
ncbi:hypothetical protein [Heliophilum fasciatum]|uniref:Uncharacterized protein n=1 Tax=Heliophilum fasciatum TaxID=35700 RepID=A0A4V2SWJ0_9FIRM|nr:hypothetical protein [Heliophilum fasciatum]MCW2278735.1 hypothetical protein [Heliophilum fasciatum]TCP62526.1 hypothetical protein EDD73_12124 [Heliophilum fasciatum]